MHDDDACMYERWDSAVAGMTSMSSHSFRGRKMLVCLLVRPDKSVNCSFLGRELSGPLVC